MHGKNIVVVGLQSWDNKIGSNCINIAKEFSKQNNVLYVNRATDRATIWRNFCKGIIDKVLFSKKSIKKSITNPIPNIWVFDPPVVLESVNWLPPFLFNFANKYNSKRLARTLKRAIEHLDFENSILFVDNDFFRAQYLSELITFDTFIYYIRDYLITQPYFKRHGALAEKQIIRKADLVLANSPALSNYAKQFNDNSHDIGQGCDFSYFDYSISYTKPAELEKLVGPIIGYVGALVQFRLDIKLLEDAIIKKPEWNWVFIGPEDNEFERSRLHGYQNVFFLGSKAETELAPYIQYFDVCINPQLVNEFTNGNYPRKIDEYLVMGKPVVARATEFMNMFLPYVHLYRGIDDFNTTIEIALMDKADQQKAQEKHQYALSHSWESSVSKLYHFLTLNTLPHAKQQ
jgi:hypothetical protein